MQPLHSGIISIPGSPKTWTWKLSPILVPKIKEKRQKGAKVGPRRLPEWSLKSVEMHNGTSRCLLGVPVAPWTTKMVTQDTRMEKVSKLAVLDIKSDPFQDSSSHPVISSLLLERNRGPAAGAKP